MSFRELVNGIFHYTSLKTGTQEKTDYPLNIFAFQYERMNIQNIDMYCQYQ